MWVGPVWQQHFMPHPPEPITPAANKLPPRIRARTVHTAFSRIDLGPMRVFFIVSYYTKYHIVLSTKMIEKILKVRQSMQY
jgi:hypothetical protein